MNIKGIEIETYNYCSCVFENLLPTFNSWDLQKAYEENKIYLYPTTITTDVQVSYLKQPAMINWAYTVGGLGQYTYDASNSVNFDLHPSEQVDVVTGILLYSGVIIQDPTIIQVASQKIQQEDINEKS